MVSPNSSRAPNGTFSARIQFGHNFVQIVAYEPRAVCVCVSVQNPPSAILYGCFAILTNAPSWKERKKNRNARRQHQIICIKAESMSNYTEKNTKKKWKRNENFAENKSGKHQLSQR